MFLLHASRSVFQYTNDVLTMEERFKYSDNVNSQQVFETALTCSDFLLPAVQSLAIWRLWRFTKDPQTPPPMPPPLATFPKTLPFSTGRVGSKNGQKVTFKNNNLT